MDVRIVGIRGIPAAHGGFETFAERLAPYLVKNGWRVVVYCQEDGRGKIWSDTWQGIERVHIPIRLRGALGTILFDLLTVLHILRHDRGLCLTLGYNTAFLSAFLRLAGVSNVINMDGIEWARAKWGRFAKLWFWLNERLGCWLGNALIADHPEILAHLASRVSKDKIEMIPYGADRLSSCDVSVISRYGLLPGTYFTLIARPEPENSILEIVSAYSSRFWGVSLVVLGNYDASNPYHRAVLSAASSEVIFLGAIYDREAVETLRYYSMAYFHGHQVGGTNPSLVEALGAGNPILAHDNKYNRWVASDAALFFTDRNDLVDKIGRLVDSKVLREQLSACSFAIHQEKFQWDDILASYLSLLNRHAN